MTMMNLKTMPITMMIMTCHLLRPCSWGTLDEATLQHGSPTVHNLYVLQIIIMIIMKTIIIIILKANASKYDNLYSQLVIVIFVQVITYLANINTITVVVVIIITIITMIHHDDNHHDHNHNHLLPLPADLLASLTSCLSGREVAEPEKSLVCASCFISVKYSVK